MCPVLFTSESAELFLKDKYKCRLHINDSLSHTFEDVSTYIVNNIGPNT